MTEGAWAMPSSLPDMPAPTCQFEGGYLVPRYEGTASTPDKWQHAMQATFGTDSADTIGYLVECLDRVQPKDQQWINACLDGLHDLKPRDHTERLLITQMMLVHHRAVESMAEGNRKPFDRERLERHAVRLMRLFAQQAETLKKYRRNATQVINVNYVQADQAVVGCNIPQQGGNKNIANNS